MSVYVILSIFRSIVCRRFFFLIGTLYLYRCVTMYITTLPVPGMHMTCAPKVSNSQTSAVIVHPLGLILHSYTREASMRKIHLDFLLPQDTDDIEVCLDMIKNMCSWQLFAGLCSVKGSEVWQFSRLVPENLKYFGHCMTLLIRNEFSALIWTAYIKDLATYLLILILNLLFSFLVFPISLYYRYMPLLFQLAV